MFDETGEGVPVTNRSKWKMVIKSITPTIINPFDV
jgi:hypothetical protein